MSTEVFTARHIIRSGALIYGIRALGAVVSLGTTAALAYFFGTSRDIEAYFAATAFYYLSAKVMQTGGASSVLVPAYLRARAQAGQDAGWSLVSNAMNVTALFAIGLTIMVVLTVPWLVPILVPGFEGPARDTVVQLVRIMALGFGTLPIVALATVVLNAHGKFGRPELFGFLGSVAYLGTIVLGSPSFGVTAVALGMLVSSLVNFLWIFVALKRLGYRHRWVLSLRDLTLRAWIRGVRPYFGYMLVMQVQGVALTAVLSLLPQGSMAIYRYASDLMAKVTGFVSGPVNTISLPILSEKAMLGTGPELRKALARTLRASALITLPVFLVMVIGARDFVELLLRRGGFTAADVGPVAVCVAILAINIVVGPVYAVFTRAFVAIQRNGWANVVAILGQGYTLALMFLLIPKLGYVGAAWHSVGATTAVLLTAAIVLWRHRLVPDLPTLLRGSGRVLLVAAMALVAGWGISRPTWFPAWYTTWLDFFVVSFTVLGTYTLACWIFRVNEVVQAITSLAWWTRAPRPTPPPPSAAIHVT